ncbi:MAG: hypothetical protein Q9216_003539 [Gyalolechia sp. 2 TL-2023]
MARVHAKRTAAPVRTGAFRHGKTNEQRKPSYKVIIEEMTERKKKLHTTVGLGINLSGSKHLKYLQAVIQNRSPTRLYFYRRRRSKAHLEVQRDIQNPGFDRLYRLSECGTLSINDFALTKDKTSGTNSLSEQVGRLGYHFPSTVVEQACQLLGLTMAKSGHVHYDEEQLHLPRRRHKRSAQQAHMKGHQNTKSRAASAGMEMDQREIDARASFAIKDLFPKIPDQDVQHIIAQAFQKGKSRVGTAVDQPFIRRVHLAVGAYIRHTYTDYDRLLKSHSYLDARAIVQPYTLDKIIEWRDEKDEPDAVEDILREVIVISDDEEEEASDDDVVTDRGSSIEVISSHEIANNVQVKSLDYSTLDERSRLNRPPSPEDAWAPSVKFIRRLSTPPPGIARRRQDWADRQQAHRNRVWQEAISRRRNKNRAFPDKNNIESVKRPYTRPEVALPLQSYAQSLDAARIESKPWPGLPKPGGVHADHRVNQSSVVTTERRWQYDDENRPAVQLLGGTNQRPAVARSMHLDSERPIPSVESDPLAHSGQEPSPRRTQASNSDGHFQDCFIRPKIIELDDDATSPAQKRRRVEDDVLRNSEVMYKPIRDRVSSVSMHFGSEHYNGYPISEARLSSLAQQKRSQYDHGASRPMETAPYVGSTYHAAGANPFDGVPQRGSRNTAREKYANYTSPDMRLQYEQQRYSPASQSQPQSRFIQSSTLDPSSRSNVSRFMPPSNVHEPGTLLRPKFAVSSHLSHINNQHNVGVRQYNQSQDRGFPEAAARLRPPESVGQMVERHTYINPTFNRAYEDPGLVPSSTTRLSNYTLDPPRQSYEHHDGQEQYSSPRSTDRSEGARGSFCNRIEENGFMRMDPLGEHSRKAHLLEPRVVRAAPERDVSSHSAHVYANEPYVQRSRSLQGNSYIERSRDQEIVYIDSSPLMEER